MATIENRASCIYSDARWTPGKQPEETDLVSAMALHQQGTKQVMCVRIQRVLLNGMLVQTLGLLQVAILVQVLSLDTYRHAVMKQVSI